MNDRQRHFFLFLFGIVLFWGLVACVNAETNTPELGTIIPGKIAQVGQVNTYMTSCDANESFYIKAVKTDGKLWPRIKVFSPGGQEIVSEYDPNKAETLVTIPARGTCSILIDDGTSWSYIGDYSLYIQSVTDPTRAIPLSIGSTQAGNVSVYGKTDAYTYTGRSGETVVLKATKSSGDLWPRITMYSPGGQNVASKYDPSTAELKYNISITGQYVILVDDGTNWNKIGGYSLFSQVFSTGGSEPIPAPVNEVYSVLGNPGNAQDDQSGESVSSALQPVVLAGVFFVIVVCGIGLFWWKKRQGSGKASSGGTSSAARGIQVPSSFNGTVSGTVNHEIIISYSSKDKPIADAVTAGLEARGIRCWIAPRDILPGVNYQEGIMNAIISSKIMVLIFSANANESPHVIREATIAMSKKVIIIPFRIDDSPPSKTMEFIISVPHWLDAVTPPLENHIRELGDTIMILLENEKRKGKRD